METGSSGLVEVFRDASWLTADRAIAYLRVLAGISVIGVGVWIGLSHGGLDVMGKPLGTDFTSFWAASKLALAGTPALAYDVTHHAAAERAAFAGRDPGYFAFFYPPIFLLLCWPLALLSYGSALAVWIGVTGWAYARTIAAFVPSATMAIFAFPAVLTTLGHGQNAFLSTALFGGAILAFGRGRSVTAGILFGALAFKPHLGLLIPLFLVASGAWATIAAATVTVLALAAIVTLAFGPGIWSAFLASTPLARQALESDLVGAEKMQSAFAAVRLWHGPVPVAYATQLVVALACAATLLVFLRAGRDHTASGVLLVTASVLASPFLLDYDLTLLAIPLAWVFAEARRTGFHPWEKLVLTSAFVLPLVSRMIAGLVGVPLGPVVVAALLLVVVRRGTSAGSIPGTSHAAFAGSDGPCGMTRTESQP